MDLTPFFNEWQENPNPNGKGQLAHPCGVGRGDGNRRKAGAKFPVRAWRLGVPTRRSSP